MPKFYEVYGSAVETVDEKELSNRRQAFCPFTQNTCDGGGNRHQTKIKLNHSDLRPLFIDELNSIIPGVCSIEYKHNETWIVCPRRLLGFNTPANQRLIENFSLQEHERAALLACGIPTGVELGVWSEVYVQYGNDDATINYHIDFVVAEIYRNQPLSKLIDEYGITDQEEIKELVKTARTGGYIVGKFNLAANLPYLPNLATPTIIEVMTASTSGSDRENRTDIGASFEDALLGRDYECPGINKRQVWGRMATQLFAKSALAEAWGGKTIWLVQDELLKNIELTTKLQLNSTANGTSETINFISMAYKASEKGVSSLKVDRYLQKVSGLSFNGSSECSDILLPKITPKKTELLKSVLRREIAAIIKL